MFDIYCVHHWYLCNQTRCVDVLLPITRSSAGLERYNYIVIAYVSWEWQWLTVFKHTEAAQGDKPCTGLPHVCSVKIIMCTCILPVSVSVCLSQSLLSVSVCLLSVSGSLSHTLCLYLSLCLCLSICLCVCICLSLSLSVSQQIIIHTTLEPLNL